MIYFRPHDGRSLRYNANARHLNVLVVPLFPLWIIGAFCVKDSKWLLNFVVVFYRICASFRRPREQRAELLGSRFSEFLPFPAACLSNVNELAKGFEERELNKWFEGVYGSYEIIFHRKIHLRLILYT